MGNSRAQKFRKRVQQLIPKTSPTIWRTKMIFTSISGKKMRSRPVYTEKIDRERLARKAAVNAVNIEKRGANNPSTHLRRGDGAEKTSEINNIKIVWWAREDSNLQPSGYERATVSEKVSDYWHFRGRSVTSVRVWLRRFIGYLLVECESCDREFCITVRYRLRA
jgi:hypothetical protein